jgi:hypothetical protein
MEYKNHKLYRNLLFISKKYDLNLTKNTRMGIIPLVLITVIIAIFVLSKIPNFTLTRKVIIAAAILMLFSLELHTFL